LYKEIKLKIKTILYLSYIVEFGNKKEHLVKAKNTQELERIKEMAKKSMVIVISWKIIRTKKKKGRIACRLQDNSRILLTSCNLSNSKSGFDV